jgi:hypothetical protein
MLIKAVADLHAVNHRGKTDAEEAAARGFKLVEQLLVRAAKDVNHDEPQQIV